VDYDNGAREQLEDVAVVDVAARVNDGEMWWNSDVSRR
jgi:hypothetical protein